MTQHQRYDKERLKREFTSHLDDLVCNLFQGKKIARSGKEYRIGSKGSIAINRRNATWYDHETQAGGDIFEMLIHFGQCTSFPDAIMWVATYLGIKPNDTVEGVQYKPLASSDSTSASLGKEEEDRVRLVRASAIWERGVKIDRTLAERYLNETRGIRLNDIPTNIRFTHVYHKDTGQEHPALVARVERDGDQFCGVHVIYLDDKGRKAFKERTKLSFGVLQGGSVHFGQLANGRIGICEGIEDALAVRYIFPSWHVWAGVGGGGTVNMAVPHAARWIRIFADHDEAGKKIAEKTRDRLLADRPVGRKVAITYPPTGKDWNEYLNIMEGY
jgi:Toprim domain